MNNPSQGQSGIYHRTVNSPIGPVAGYCLTAALDTGAGACSLAPQGWDLPGEANGAAVSPRELQEHGPSHRARPEHFQLPEHPHVRNRIFP